MVWFYRGSNTIYIYYKLDFQSHYGLILSRAAAVCPTVHCPAFQSHYGLILSLLFSVKRNFSCFLSIPLWSDFIPPLMWKVRAPLVSAFNPTMVWFYRIFNGYYRSGTTILSIPLWSDFIDAATSDLSDKEIPFNPTMVWFYHSELDSTTRY